MEKLIKKAVTTAQKSYKDNEKFNDEFQLAIKMFEKGASISLYNSKATPQYQNIIRINDTEGKYLGGLLIRRGITVDWDEVGFELIEEIKYNLK